MVSNGRRVEPEPGCPDPKWVRIFEQVNPRSAHHVAKAEQVRINAVTVSGGAHYVGGIIKRGIMNMGDLTTSGVPDDLRLAVETAAQADGKSVDEIANDALKRRLGQRALDRLKRRSEANRTGKSDEEIEAIVSSAISELRGR